jgi:hypothetical protein
VSQEVPAGELTVVLERVDPELARTATAGPPTAGPVAESA